MLSGADELRQIVNVLNNSRESAVDGYSAHEIVRIVRACRASGYDITPGDVPSRFLTYAAQNGRFANDALAWIVETYG